MTCMIMYDKIILVSIMILVSDDYYYCQNLRGEAWGVSWLRSSRTLQLCLTPEEEMWFWVAIKTLVTLGVKKSPWVLPHPHMTWAILTTCERERTLGLLKFSVKNNSK